MLSDGWILDESNQPKDKGGWQQLPADFSFVYDLIEAYTIYVPSSPFLSGRSPIVHAKAFINAKTEHNHLNWNALLASPQGIIPLASFSKANSLAWYIYCTNKSHRPTQFVIER